MPTKKTTKKKPVVIVLTGGALATVLSLFGTSLFQWDGQNTHRDLDYYRALDVIEDRNVPELYRRSAAKMLFFDVLDVLDAYDRTAELYNGKTRLQIEEWRRRIHERTK